MMDGMRPAHLGLLVGDQDRSLRFYAPYFGFDPDTATRYPDGTVIIRDRDGFDLALHAADQALERPPFLHFGFRYQQPQAVRDLLARFRADDVSSARTTRNLTSSRSSVWTRTGTRSTPIGSPSPLWTIKVRRGR
jgi:hypothetical protein